MHSDQIIQKEEKRKESRLWNRYRCWAQANQHILWLVDESISRILFWTPPSFDSRWREAIWGILELHRFALDIATCDPEKKYFGNNAYGTSVEIIPTTNDKIPANHIRTSLTIIQHLLPVVLAIISQDQREDTNRQRMIRKYIERVRFVLRFTLLTNYWRRILAKKNQGSSLGLLLQGGQYDMSFIVGVPWQQEKSRMERIRYVGSRTGRRIHTTICHDDQNHHNQAFRDLRVILGEILYILRPLLQTETTGSAIMNWRRCLLMDVISLLLLSQKTANRITEDEWKRRRVRLLLYLLRPPMYNEHTVPTAEFISKKLTRIPLVGRLLSNYIWDYMNYWEYRAEEL
jgi:hypothetical protein